MKRPILFFALILSIAFNLFFVLGAMRASSKAEPSAFAAEVQALAASPVALELNEEQRSVYDELAAAHKKQRDRLLEDQVLIREELINAFRSSSPDRARLRELIDQHVEITHQIQADSATRFREFLSALTPMQRRHVADRVRTVSQIGQHQHRLPPALRHFDADGDGHLNQREAQRARAAHRAMGEQRWNRMNSTRPQTPTTPMHPQRNRDGDE